MNQTNPGRTAKRTAETIAEEGTTIEWAIEIKAATTTTEDETMTIVEQAITEITTTLTTETTVIQMAETETKNYSSFYFC